MIDMVSFQVRADLVIVSEPQAAVELNVMMTVVALNRLISLTILTNG